MTINSGYQSLGIFLFLSEVKSCPITTKFSFCLYGYIKTCPQKPGHLVSLCREVVGFSMTYDMVEMPTEGSYNHVGLHVITLIYTTV